MTFTATLTLSLTHLRPCAWVLYGKCPPCTSGSYAILIVSSAVLRSEGRTTNAPQEDKPTPNIIQELDALFPDPSKISFPDLELLAKKVYLRYMTTKAYQYALGDILRPDDICGTAGPPMDPVAADGEKVGWDGDRQMANLTLRMRDCLWYYELCHAIVDGDIGRVMEIIKVIPVATE